MGNLQAAEMAAAAHAGVVSLRRAVYWNLTSNMYPPLMDAESYSEIIADTILAVQGGGTGPEDLVDLGEDLKMLPKRAFQHEGEGPWYVTVADLLDATHCWHFIEEEN